LCALFELVFTSQFFFFFLFLFRKDEFDGVFGNSETLLHLNAQFLEDLRAAPRDGIGSVFESFAPMFRLYSNFCANFSRSFDTVKVLRARPASAAILKLVMFCFVLFCYVVLFVDWTSKTGGASA
jgi:hypothetical protein